MRTTTRVHTPEERRKMRIQGDRLARVCQVQMLCVASMLRTLIAEVVPLCGSAGWWVAPVCLLPGLAVYTMLAAVMKRRGASTLMEAVRGCLGPAGVWCGSFLLATLLLMDGAASMTALVTSFTEGIGTEGTQITMAALTLGALVLCLHRDGLPWGMWLMRRVLQLLAVLIAAVLLSMARADGMHPVLGQGKAAILSALKSGASMGWPLVVLLTVKQPRPGRVRPLAIPILACAAMALLMCLTYPCEALVQSSNLAARLLLPVLHLPPALRTLAHCLGMLSLLMSMATAVQLAGEHLLLPSGRELVWLPYVLAALLALTQCLPISGLWRWLCTLNLWLPALLVLLVILMLVRRKSCSDV